MARINKVYLWVWERPVYLENVIKIYPLSLFYSREAMRQTVVGDNNNKEKTKKGKLLCAKKHQKKKKKKMLYPSYNEGEWRKKKQNVW